MDYAPEQASIIINLLSACLNSDEPSPIRVKKALWTLIYARLSALTNGLRQMIPDQVYRGPFKGMKLTKDILDIYKAPVLLGGYEHELHPIVEKIISTGYAHILNIGCSAGYYAVGLAMRMPTITVEAFDIEPAARAKCLAMAQANNVTDRIKISGEFHGEDFAKYADQKTLVFMDIEGAEKILLNPQKYPELTKMDVVVEMHDVMDATISPLLVERFTPTHAIDVIPNRPYMPDLDGLVPVGLYIDSFDRLMMTWEGRDGLTPWGIFTAKS